MKTAGVFLLLFCSVLFSAYGCAAVREKRPVLEEKAADASIRGAEAFEMRDYMGALYRFENALQLNRSIDNRPGELVDLINIARVYVALGDYKSAEDRIEKAIMLAVQMDDRKKLSEARATLAKARWLAGDSGAALKEIEDALSIDAKNGVRSGARMNLKALILIDAGRADDAAGVLSAALSVSKAENNIAETANSYRALARVNEIGKKWNDALALYSSAYAIDKTAGDPVKIAAGLMGMGEASLALKRLTDAVFFFERAYTVSANAGLAAKTALSLDKLILAYKEMGNAEKAAFYSRVREAISGNGDAGGVDLK